MQKSCKLGVFFWLMLVSFAQIAQAAYLDNGDTITDTVSGLEWQKETMGPMTWQAALASCEDLDLAGKSDWRLPDRNELRSLVDYSRYAPSIDPIFAATTQSSMYWSSTTDAFYTYYAWRVYFYNGQDGYLDNKSNSYYVRAVRGGQCGGFENLVISDSGDDYLITVTLSEPLAANTYVAINFDNQAGGWLAQSDDGGHIPTTGSGTTYSVVSHLDYPGLRSFRAGIFDATTHVLQGCYSASSTCTLDKCLAAISHPKNYGNPAVTVSGSELFNNVDVAKGSYHLAKVDMSVAAKGPSFAFSRAYNSLHKSPWTFAYEMTAQFQGGFQQEIAIGPREDGHMQYFFKDMANPGQWHALNPGDFDKLIENVDAGFSLYTQGNRLYNFADPAGVKAGRLETIKDRLNNALSFTYDGSNNLTGVTDANGRIYAIGRDAGNRIFRVTDFSGRYVEYTYDSNNMITNVRKMRGDTYYDRYSYHSSSPTFLTSISDARVYPATQLDITYTPDPITNDLYRVHTLTNPDGQTEFIYGSSAQWGVYTGVSQPQVDAINHNRVYITDAGRVVKMYDAKSAADALASGDIVTTKTYKKAADNTRFADLGLVTQTSDPKNNNTTIAYNDTIGGGKPSQITDALAQNIEANYNSTEVGVNLRPVISVVQKEAGAGNADLTTQYQTFTPTGQAQVITDAEGNTTNRAFDAGHGLITQTTDARNNVLQYDYDLYGNVIQTTQVVNTGNIVTTRTYYNDNDPTSPGRLKTEVSPLGLVTTYTYDAHGNILSRNESKVADGINYTTYYAYDASDNLIKTTDPKGNITGYTYDTLNRKIQESYKATINGTLETLTTNYAYDALSRLKTVTNERGQSGRTHYTARSQVKYKVNPLNETTVTYTYDKNGNIETVTDAENRVVTTTYDELNRKTRVTDNLGNYQAWTYNTAGQVASYRDGGGNISYYAYDKVGNLTRLTDPEGGITESTYDGNGNVLTVKDPNGQMTTYVYDALDRRISTTLHNGQQWTYTYDASGNVLSEITPTGEKTEKVYDALNRVTHLTEKAANATIVRQISYAYDGNNNVLSQTSGASSINYTYDEINRVSTITDQYGQAIAYGYDQAGNRTTLTYPGNKAISYSYDAADRLQNLTDWLGNTTSYSRNNAGQATEVVYGNGTKVNFQYDDAGRVTLQENLKADNSVISRHSMTLDGAGNITNANTTLPLDPSMPPTISSMTYDDNNRILTADSNSYVHDDSGRITETDENGVVTAYNFNIKDLLTSVTRSGNPIVEYGYDLNNSRISQTQSGAETRYVIDQLAGLPNVIAETNDQGTVSTYYIYGEGLVAQIDASNNSHFYHFDPTGHTLALSDGNGAVTDEYAYAPYGFTTGEGTTHNPFRYVGRHGVMDDGNGLHYMRARYYKEGIKRFMSLDALHGEVLNPQSLNRYAYVLGNPVMGVDPSGMWRQSPGEKIITGLTGFGIGLASVAAVVSSGGTVLIIPAALGAFASFNYAVVGGVQLVDEQAFPETYRAEVYNEVEEAIGYKNQICNMAFSDKNDVQYCKSSADGINAVMGWHGNFVNASYNLYNAIDTLDDVAPETSYGINQNLKSMNKKMESKLKELQLKKYLDSLPKSNATYPLMEQNVCR